MTDYLDEMTTAYAECALWCGLDDADETDACFLAPETLETMRAECAEFLAQAGALTEGLAPDQVGHDFWLTRCHHGAGFWDRGLGQRGEQLSALACQAGERWLYVGDDGAIYQA